jgi:hypothetical protein
LLGSEPAFVATRRDRLEQRLKGYGAGAGLLAHRTSGELNVWHVGLPFEKGQRRVEPDACAVADIELQAYRTARAVLI